MATQLSERNSERFAAPLIAGEHDVIMHDRKRRCTDIICLFLFVVAALGFFGLLTYSLIAGDGSSIFAVYNAKQQRCDRTAYPMGYFPNPLLLTNAICIDACPEYNQQTVSCLPDGQNCLSGSYSQTMMTFQFSGICVPDASGISIFFSSDAMAVWAYDVQMGYPILIAAVLFSMAASLLFLVVVRCCTGLVIWLAIAGSIGGTFVVGLLYILESQGVHISPYLDSELGSTSHDSLIIIGSAMMVASVLLLLLVICLHSRIQQGCKAVELAALFLFENCYFIILPITQAVLVAGGVAAIVMGSLALYSLGQISFPNNSGFAHISLNTGHQVMVGLLIGGGLWVVFFFHGCNHFMLCSSAAIWYFNYESKFDLGRPFRDSIWRLVRYHSGSIAATSLANGFFFLFKLLAHIFSFSAKDQDNKCTAFCLKCLNCFFCIFKIFLRLLCDGTYVQIAVFGKGYFRSSLKAFSLLADNAVRLSLTEGISLFFTVLGVLGISIGISTAAYFSCIEIQTFAQLLTDPIIITFLSFILSFVIASVYLAMIDLSAQAMMQCYLIDHHHHNGNPRYASPAVSEAILAKQ